MAYDTTARDTKTGKKDAKGILAQARADYDRAIDREQDNIDLGYDDLNFLSAHDYSQWPEKQRKERENDGRPVLQVNRLQTFIDQITGDIRQMRPAIKVVPVDNGADEKIANLYAGLIRYVENRSDASAIYFRAADSQVACGVGAWRVTTEYSDQTFNQEIRIAPIEDPVAVLWDPDSILPTKEDAQFCHVPVDMSRAAFEAKYPGVSPSDFDDKSWGHNEEWCTDDYVRVSEYWVKKATKKLIALGLDGAITDLTDADESVVAFHKARGSRIEERESTKVCRYLITASDVLEGPKDWPGKYIPIVPIFGREIRIGRKLIRKGIVRDAKDPQRMVNYFESAHTETVGLQPKAPFMVTETNVAKYQGLWEEANTKNLPYLPYEPDSKNGGAPPQRVQPPVSSQGINDGLLRAHENLKGVIGIYDAGLGDRSNETSGKAIIARQREGDVGSFVFLDNFARGVKHTGNIIVDLIPHIYDTERTIRIMGEDGKVDVLEVNKAAGLDPESGQTLFEHDMTVGSYDVVAQIGPSYSTKREEAKEGMISFLQAAPEAGALILDLMAKAQDWPMADDISKRFRANLPPMILAMEEAEKQGLDPEQARLQAMQANQPPPDPKVIEMQAKLEMEQQKMAFDQEKARADMELQVQKQQAEQALAEQKLMAEIALKQEELRAKLAIEQERLQVETQIKTQQAAVDADLRRQDMEARSEERKQAAKSKKKETA